MKIELKKMVLDNYKKFKADDGVKEFDFFHRTQITGRNKEGKSTLVNAYLEILTGKELDGSQPESVRPHDENGKDCNDAEVIREITLLIDGKEKKIRKITKKNFNSRKKVYTGNSTEYEIDDFGANATKFKEFISGISDPDVLLMCSNANPFLTTLRKSTADARKILEKMAGFNLQNFIASNPKYAVIDDLTKGHSVEDAFKKLRKDLTAQKKKVEAQNERIKHEQSRPLASGGIELSDLELMKGEWRDKIAELDNEEHALDDSVAAYDSLSAEIVKLKGERAVIETTATNELLGKRLGIREKISNLETKKRDLEFSIFNRKNAIEIESERIERLAADIDKFRERYEAESNKEYDESALREIEAEQFDESSYICPTCGQELPPEKKEELLSDYLESKKTRIKAEEDMRNAFYIQQDSELKEIEYFGNKYNEDLRAAKGRKSSYEKEVSELEAKLESLSSDIEKASAELCSIQETPDAPQNAEYADLSDRISEKEKQLASLDSGAEKRAELRQKRAEYAGEISKIDAQIQTAIRERENRENILAILQDTLREMVQIQANIERKIDILSEFSMAKNEALAKKINPHFRHFEFRFLEYTIEGNPVETCKLMCRGTSYFGGLNGGDKRLVEADLCRGFQEMNGICAPIWLDEANTVDPERIPVDMAQQLITIQRTDGELKVGHF